MNVYARIRGIENAQEFKRFTDSLLGSEHGADYQSLKEWKDYGIDGYLTKEKTVYAIYCPRYPERRELKQYTKKISGDIYKLKSAIEEAKVSLPVVKWVFVTPDDLPLGVVDLVNKECAQNKWEPGTLTAQVLAPLFMKHSHIHADFPMITAGLQFDKIPSVSVNLARNRDYVMLEVFNDGTEDIKDIEVVISGVGVGDRDLTHHFMYELDNPVIGSVHSLFNLKKGERQYGSSIPSRGGFKFRVVGIGVESGKTFIKEGDISESPDGGPR